MFFFIDSLLNEKAQWAVRQLELFTKITRKEALRHLSAFTFLLSRIHCVMVIAITVQKASSGISFLGFIQVYITCVYLAFVWNYGRNIFMFTHKHLQEKGVVEANIRVVTRTFLFLWMLCTPLILIHLYNMLPDEGSSNAIDAIIISTGIGIILSAGIANTTEYFLLTRSLTTEEKAEKKRQREQMYIQ